MSSMLKKIEANFSRFSILGLEIANIELHPLFSRLLQKANLAFLNSSIWERKFKSDREFPTRSPFCQLHHIHNLIFNLRGQIWHCQFSSHIQPAYMR